MYIYMYKIRLFYRRQIVGWKDPIFYRTKTCCTRSDFHSDFFVYDKKMNCVRWAFKLINHSAFQTFRQSTYS